MVKKEFDNTNKNPNVCHEMLVTAGITVFDFSHDRQYGETGEVETEAITLWITVPDEQAGQAEALINSFLNTQ